MDGKLLLIALDANDLPLSEETRAACVFTAVPRRAIQLLAEGEEPAIVVSRPLKEEEKKALLEALRARSPSASLLIVARTIAGAKLVVIKEAKPGCGSVETLPLERLEREVLRLRREQIVSTVRDQLKDIGFNESVHNDEGVHVQTEVVGKRRPEIRTTVFERGIILRTQSQSLAEVCDSASKAQAAIRAQHEQVVAEVRNGTHRQ